MMFSSQHYDVMKPAQSCITNVFIFIDYDLMYVYEYRAVESAYMTQSCMYKMTSCHYSICSFNFKSSCIVLPVIALLLVIVFYQNLFSNYFSTDRKVVVILSSYVCFFSVEMFDA